MPGSPSASPQPLLATSMQPGGDFGANWGVNSNRLCFGSTMGIFCEKYPFLPNLTLSHGRSQLGGGLLAVTAGAPQFVMQLGDHWGSRGLRGHGPAQRGGLATSLLHPSLDMRCASPPSFSFSFFKRVFN